MRRVGEHVAGVPGPSSKLVVITLTNCEIFASVSAICSFLPTNRFCLAVQLDFCLLKNKDDSVPIIIICGKLNQQIVYFDLSFEPLIHCQKEACLYSKS